MRRPSKCSTAALQGCCGIYNQGERRPGRGLACRLGYRFSSRRNAEVGRRQQRTDHFPQPGVAFVRDIPERDPDSEKWVADPHFALHIHVQAIQSQTQIDHGAHGISGCHLDVAAMHAQVGERSPGAHVRPFHPKFCAALTLVARAQTPLARPGCFLILFQPTKVICATLETHATTRRRDRPLQRFYRDSVPSGIVTKVDFRRWNRLGFLLWEQIQEWETDTASAALRISCHNCSRPTPVLAEKGTTRAPGYFS